jgi:hypothetical protein
MSRTRHWGFALLLPQLLLGLTGSAHGQADSGARVRVTTSHRDQRPWVGTLLSADGDSVRLIASANRRRVVVPTDSVVRMERSSGRRSQTGHGAAVGALVGGATGLVLGLLASSEEDSFVEIGPGEVAGVTLFFAAAGGGLGALIGAASHRDRWEPMPLPARSQAQAERARGSILKLTLRF